MGDEGGKHEAGEAHSNQADQRNGDVSRVRQTNTITP